MLFLTLLRCKKKGLKKMVSKDSSSFVLCTVSKFDYLISQLPYAGTSCYLCVKQSKGSQRNTKSVDLTSNPRNHKYNNYDMLWNTQQSKNHNSIFIAQNNSCETCYILFVKNEQLQNKSNVTFPKNTKKYSVKHLLIKYKLSFCDALHQCFAYTLMQRKF